MLEALKEASKALSLNEVPIAAIIVKDDEIISIAHNTNFKDKLTTSHAEINAINEACNKLKRAILDDCEMYVTVEPCLMCAGAILNARIKRLYYGAKEPKTGAHTSKYVLLANEEYNHNIEVYDGFYEEEARNLLKEFFKRKR